MKWTYDSTVAQLQQGYRQDGAGWRLYVRLGSWLACCGALAWLLVPGLVGHTSASTSVQQWLMVAALSLLVLSGLAEWHWRSHGVRQRWLDSHAGQYVWLVESAGLTLLAPTRTSFYAWPEVMALSEDAHGYYLQLTGQGGIRVPASAIAEFPDAQFADQVRHHWQQHPDTHGQLPHYVSTRQAWSTLLRGLASNLWAGLKLATAAPVAVTEFRVGRGHLLMLVVAEISVFAASDYVKSLPLPVFNLYGLIEYGTAVLLFVLAAMAISYASANRSSLLRLLVMLLAALLVVETLYLLADALWDRAGGYDAPVAWTLWGIQVVWTLLAVARAIHLLYRQTLAVTLRFTGIYAVLVLAIGSSLLGQNFFVSSPAQQADQAQTPWPELDAEATYYRQPALVAQQLASLQPQRKGVSDMYFVGFAGQAEEKVFANEVRFAQRLFEQRFGTSGRSLSLLNSWESVQQMPLANAHNLAGVLNHLGQVMDRDQDILFLFLSSHGARDFDLSVSMPGLSFNDLSPAELKQLLDAAGIRNRVIVVSACFSGGWLDVLQDPYSLIITASRRDRASFGCGTEADYTYFGDAFFIQALRQQRSFTQAFEQARRIIAARERLEQPKAEPSEPQMSMGVAIQPILQRWQDALAQPQTTAP